MKQFRKIRTFISAVIAGIFVAVILVNGGTQIVVSALKEMLQVESLDGFVLPAVERIIAMIGEFSLAAIPFFVLAGNLMKQDGIVRRLINFVLALVGKLPGSLLLTNVGANALCGAVSDSASAAATVVGNMVFQGEDELGYGPAVCAAANGASAPSGLLMPPSNAMLVYSLVSGGTSIAALFLAGYIPGIIWVLACVIGSICIAGIKGYRGLPGRFDWKYLIITTVKTLPSLALIVVVIGGIITGHFTVTKASVVAAVYALFLCICYKNITLKKFWEIVVESAKTSVWIVLLIGVFGMLGWIMEVTQIPQEISSALLRVTDNPYVILLIMNVILLIAGAFMDSTAAILMFTPLFLPIAQSFGMNAVHFGMVLIYNLCIGNIIPPFGNTLFVSIKIGKTSLSKVMPYMLIYYVLILIGLLLVTYVPVVSMGLPTFAGLI